MSEHWKTKEKRLKEEALARWEEYTPSEVHDEEPTGRPYRVYNERAALVSQVNSEEEAIEELKNFPGGHYTMI